MELVEISGTGVEKLLEEIVIANEENYKPVQKMDKEGRGERLIGPCTSTMKKLYGLMVAYDQLSDQAELDIKHASQIGDEHRHKAAVNQYLQTSAKYNTYKRLFWYEVNYHFNIWDGTDTGIREGWVIVAIPDSSRSQLRDALGI